ncbi:MAG: helix-turn-helix domain-containing protein [Thiomonas sp.]|nr:helix-turn-helix domain-containing protein [Thiomonas sp.]
MPFSYFEAKALGLATCAEAQAFLRLSRTSLWRLERAGVLTPLRIGRSLRFRWSDLRRLAGEGGAR